MFNGRMIESYSFGEIEIEGEKYTNDVIILPERVKSNWWRKEGHSLHPEDLEEVIEADPEVLVIGTGSYGRMSVPTGVRDLLEDNGIKLVVEKTESACEKFNEIASSKRAAAALHLTC